LSGEIKTINSAADPATRSFQVRVSLPDIPAIQVGMFARVLIPIGAIKMILVPETAVIAHGQLSGVYVVDDDHMAHFRLIRPGRFFGSQMEVLSGLKNGDRYIIKPDFTVVDGVRVEGI
jgi:multidrug efflux pump subunit AcrA (membrane-fusion protein)